MSVLLDVMERANRRRLPGLDDQTPVRDEMALLSDEDFAICQEEDELVYQWSKRDQRPYGDDARRLYEPEFSKVMISKYGRA